MGSGFSALAAALVVGARKDYGRQALLPHNGMFVLLGAGLLWFGWFGFNGGSGFNTGNNSVLAFTNTLLTPACTVAVWAILDAIRGRQVTAVGAATAIIVGCVVITPAGGFISPAWAMVLGALGAIPSYAVLVWRTRTHIDETLDVLAAHGIAGFTGILFIGFFAEMKWNGVADGLFYGDAGQLGSQAVAAFAAPVYAFVVTYALLRVIGAVMPLRGSDDEEAIGMDIIHHGEEAYATGEGALLIGTDFTRRRRRSRPAIDELSARFFEPPRRRSDTVRSQGNRPVVRPEVKPHEDGDRVHPPRGLRADPGRAARRSASPRCRSARSRGPGVRRASPSATAAPS